MLRTTLASLCLVPALAFPAAAQQDCSLSLTPSVAVGESFTLELAADEPVLAFVLVSLDPGPIATKAGSLDVGLPLIEILDVPLGANDTMACSAEVPCNPDYVGMTVYMQAVMAPLGSPGSFCVTNSVSMDVTTGACLGTGTEPGDYVTFTQGGWGTSCSGNNPGCRRDEHFDAVFPDGLLLGDQDGADGDEAYSLLLTSSSAVQAFLPHGGTAGALGADAVDPASVSEAGVLAGQLVAASLNLAFDDAGAFDDDKSVLGTALGDLVYVDGVHADLMGTSVRDVIELANHALAGGDLDGGLSLSDLVTALDALNNNFGDGDSDGGMLALP
jgi:hypothetical protein